MDLALNRLTNDLEIIDDDLVAVNEESSVAQRVRFALRLNQGEWFLNTTVGLPYFSTILVKNPNVTAIDALIRATATSVPGVAKVSSYSSEFGGIATNNLSVTFTVQTDIGEQVVDTIELPPSGSAAGLLGGFGIGGA